MADAGYLGGELARRVAGLEAERESDRREWNNYLNGERRRTCAAPGEVAKAVELSETRTEVKLSKVEGKLNGTITQNWILMGGVLTALLKIFGVIP